MLKAESKGEGEAIAVRKKVQQWLIEEEWQVGLKSIPNTLWALTCKDVSNRHLVVIQEEIRKDQIVIVAVLHVSPEYQRILSRLREKERNALIFELRQAILALGVEYQGIEFPLGTIQFDQRIYFDALTKDEFTQRVTKVRNAIALARNLLARHLSVGIWLPINSIQKRQRRGFFKPL